jgi:Rrf2 family transcriptional regulator, cysteine metabolism repressor
VRVSARAEYGVRAMVQLARSHGSGPVPLSQVAEKERISQDFLEQLMVTLRQRGLVRSVRGVHGGYLLAMEPGQISVGDVMTAVDGPFIPMQCLDPAHDTTCTMGMSVYDCTTRDVWALLQEKVMETLNGVTLADLCHAQGEPLRQIAMVGN